MGEGGWFRGRAREKAPPRKTKISNLQILINGVRYSPVSLNGRLYSEKYILRQSHHVSIIEYVKQTFVCLTNK
jgi:hypothetical protein